MSFVQLNYILPSPLAQDGTLTITYPAGVNAATFSATPGQHVCVVGSNVYLAPTHFTLAFGANITLTWKRPITLPQGSRLIIDADVVGFPDPAEGPVPINVRGLSIVEFSVGTPAAVDADAICTSQAVVSAQDMVLTDEDGIAADVPRAVSIVSSSASDTSAKTIQVFGYRRGEALSETIPFNGQTTAVGKKAFDRVTRVYAPAALTGNAQVGWSKAFGLPTPLGCVGYARGELVNGEAAGSAGTFRAADVSSPTLTTSDTCGLWTPADTPDGSKGFSLLMLTGDASEAGGPQNGH